jgi:rare lipoprotein A
MRHHVARRALGLACIGFFALAGAVAAQPAQIVYAGQGGFAQPTASADRGLTGGGENSYGYGSTVTRARGAVIDIRRPSSSTGVHAEPISYQEAPVEDADDMRPLPQAEPQQVAPRQPAPQQVAEVQTPAQPAQAAPSGEQGARPWLERERVGPPYQANGQWYVPTPEPGYEQSGTASWYGPTFNGQRTASGEVFDQTAITAAHPTLPIPSLVQVTNLENGREVIVRVNDRGPFVGNRLIDVSQGAAQVLGIDRAGTARVHIRYLGPAPRHVDANGADVPAPTPALSGGPAAPAQQEGPASLLPPQNAQAAQPAPVEQTPLPAYQASAPAPVGGGYFVQVGAFSELENAHRVRAEVLSAGPVVVDTRATANGELFRVRVGPWTSRAEAEAARQTLAQLGYANGIVAAR